MKCSTGFARELMSNNMPCMNMMTPTAEQKTGLFSPIPKDDVKRVSFGLPTLNIQEINEIAN